MSLRHCIPSTFFSTQGGGIYFASSLGCLSNKPTYHVLALLPLTPRLSKVTRTLLALLKLPHMPLLVRNCDLIEIELGELVASLVGR
jgi:hypothetical protein